MISKKYFYFLFIIFSALIAYKFYNTNRLTNIKSLKAESKKVIFIAHTRSVGGKGIYPIYKEMKNLGINVKIALLPLFYEDKKLSKEIDFEFANTFDKEDVIFPCGKYEPYTCNSINDLKPDYIFTQMPYDPYIGTPLDPYFRNNYLKKISKIALIVYGPHIFHQMGMNNKTLPDFVDTIFVDSEVSKDIYIKYFDFEPSNVVVSGYQPYKDIRDKIKANPAEGQNTRQETILWLPRWQLSFVDRDLYEGGSTFLSYHYYFYNYFKNHPDINLIFRPHYGLFLLRDKFLTSEDLESIFSKFRKLSNVKISYHANTSLTEDILNSDIIISDGSSALAEVVVADKPIIYLSNGTNNEFNSNDLSKQLKKEIYLAYNPVDIERYITEIRNNNYKVQYSEEFKKHLDPVENPASYIANYIFNN